MEVAENVTGTRSAARTFAVPALAVLAAALAGRARAGGAPDWKAELDKAIRSRDAAGAVRWMEFAAARRLPGAGEAFARAFESGNVWIRRGAVRGSAVTGGKLGLEVLVRALDDPDALVRLDACMLAGRVDPGDGLEELAGALAGRLSDDRRGVRAEACRALGRLGAKSEAFALSDAASRDRDPRVRVAAVEALGRLGERNMDDLVRVVRGALDGDADDRVRASAAIALGSLKPPGVEDALAAALKDVSARVRASATAGLALVGSDGAIKALEGALALDDAALRAEATRQLSRAGGAKALAALRRALSPRMASEVRREAAQALGQLGDRASAGALTRLARDPDPNVRAAVVEALGRIADPGAMAVIQMSLSDNVSEVRARAAEAAGRLGDVGSIPVLVGLTRAEWSDGERVAAITSLGFLGDQRVASHLVTLLDDRSDPVRRAATAALSRLGLGGEQLLAREARYKGVARLEFLGALALERVTRARTFFEKELASKETGPRARFACEAGLYLLGDQPRRDAVMAGALGRREGGNPVLAMTALIMARDPKAQDVVMEVLSSRSPQLRESAAFALAVTRPDWAGPFLRRAAADRHRGVALRARVGLRWLELPKPRSP